MNSLDTSHPNSSHEVGSYDSASILQSHHQHDSLTSTDLCSLMTMLYLLLDKINGSFMPAFSPPTSATRSSYEYPDPLSLTHCSFLPWAFSFIAFSLFLPPDFAPFHIMASRRSSIHVPRNSHNNLRWENPSMHPRTRYEELERREALNYVVSINLGTQYRIHNLEL